MATLYRASGVVERVTPKSRNRWTLTELQAAVGGYIEMMPDVEPMRMVMNEEGKLKGLPFNAKATGVLHVRMAKTLGCKVTDLPREVGRRLRYLPQLVGDVLVLEPGERM